MPKPNSPETSLLEVPPIHFRDHKISSKWMSPEQYLESLGVTRWVAAATRRATATSTVNVTTDWSISSGGSPSNAVSSSSGDELSVSDLEREEGGTSRAPRSFSPGRDITFYKDILGSTPTSDIEELRTIFDELRELLDKDLENEMRTAKDVLSVSNAIGRDEALKEVSKALRERASSKFTMGRSERLILEREADNIFRMTCAGPVGNFGQCIDALQAKRQEMRETVSQAVEMLDEKACELARRIRH